MGNRSLRDEEDIQLSSTLYIYFFSIYIYGVGKGGKISFVIITLRDIIE